MIRKDFHTHTTYCDGADTPEAMVLAAVSMGMTDIGFSGHAYISFDESYCMSPEGTARYLDELHDLRDRYSDLIRIHIGAEWDYNSDGKRDGFEYLIGSVHYFEKDGRLLPVDESVSVFRDSVISYFDGDYYAAAENYYAIEADILARTGADIIGHFDLVTKFNEADRLFDTSCERYREAWMKAADVLLKYGKPFEINTGAITRGYRSSPYPSEEIIDYIGTRGGSFILSSDSHSVHSLMYGFDELEKKVRAKGYKLLG